MANSPFHDNLLVAESKNLLVPQKQKLETEHLSLKTHDFQKERAAKNNAQKNSSHNIPEVIEEDYRKKIEKSKEETS